MERNCNICKWYINEDCTNIQSISNCPLLSYPLWESKEITKEDTVEEAAEICYMSGKIPVGENKIVTIVAFKAGATWQKEQANKLREAMRQEFEEWHNNLPEGSPMYTEEEVKNLISLALDEFTVYPIKGSATLNINFNIWFENNKKK